MSRGAATATRRASCGSSPSPSILRARTLPRSAPEPHAPHAPGHRDAVSDSNGDTQAAAQRQCVCASAASGPAMAEANA
eukprot:2721314-Rhodomonas_salina.1